MGLRAIWRQVRQEWADTPEPRARKHRRPEPSGTCDQRGCEEPTYGHNRTCNGHIAGL